eukprot:537865-Heterocapsa_arctica.AAC.1
MRPCPRGTTRCRRSHMRPCPRGTARCRRSRRSRTSRCGRTHRIAADHRAHRCEGSTLGLSKTGGMLEAPAY